MLDGMSPLDVFIQGRILNLFQAPAYSRGIAIPAIATCRVSLSSTLPEGYETFSKRTACFGTKR